MGNAVTVRYEQNIAIVELLVNTFTKEFYIDIQAVFDEIKNKAEIKVVLVHGRDTYFTCGGSKEELEGLINHVGEMSFDDLKFYRLLLDCELPTISAMQGHALGGGLAFGCYGDILLMSEKSMYGTNFMRYGFTPGMGATYIVPYKLGAALGSEMLFTAHYYFGHQLKARGVNVQILPSNEVIPEAMRIAKELAEKPLTSLKLLKEHLAAPIRHDLAGIIAKEKAMHEVSMKLPEVKDLVQNKFYN